MLYAQQISKLKAEEESDGRGGEILAVILLILVATTRTVVCIIETILRARS